MFSRQANEISIWVIGQLANNSELPGVPGGAGNSRLVPQSTFERHARLILICVIGQLANNSELL